MLTETQRTDSDTRTIQPKGRTRMLRHDLIATMGGNRKTQLYGEIITRFFCQGGIKGAIYGAGVGVWIWIIGALFGAPIGYVAGIVLGLIEGIIVGYLVVYHDIPFRTTGTVIAVCITSSTVIITAAVTGAFTSGNNYVDPIAVGITLFLAGVAGFATWQGSNNVAKWYEKEIANE